MTDARDDTRRHLSPVEPTYDPYDDGYDEPAPNPAQNTPAEQALLGAVLATPQIAPAVIDALDASDFHRTEHESIWAAITSLTTNGRTPDPAHVLEQLQHDGDLVRVGGGVYLHTLYSRAPGTTSPEQAHDYARIILDAARLRRLGEVVTRLSQTARTARADSIDDALAQALQDLDTAVAKVGSSTARTGTSWASLSLEEVLNGGEVDPPPAILPRADGPCLIYAGAVHTLAGEPGSGKTWIALVAALSELQAGRTVAMVDFEDRASRVVARLLALGAHPDQIRHHFRYVRPHAALDEAGRRDLTHAVTGTSLVILDGVTEAMTLHGLDLSSNPDIAAFLALLPRWVADHGPAVIMVDHVVKDTDRQGRWSIGGQHKLAGIDGVAYLVKAVEPFGRGKHGRARVVISKDRPGHVEEIAVGRTAAEFTLDATDILCLRAVVEPPAALPVNDAGDMRPTILMERVSRWLEMSPNSSRRAISDSVSGKSSYVRRALDRLIQEGYVEIEKGARNAEYHRVLTPFRNEPDTPEETADETLV